MSLQHESLLAVRDRCHHISRLLKPLWARNEPTSVSYNKRALYSWMTKGYMAIPGPKILPCKVIGKEIETKNECTLLVGMVVVLLCVLSG